jgi:hypothetical protein
MHEAESHSKHNVNAYAIGSISLYVDLKPLWKLIGMKNNKEAIST